jgi:recombination protein RecR
LAARGLSGTRIETFVKYSPAIQEVVDRLRRLPGLGVRSAERIVFHLLASERSQIGQLADALRGLGDKVRACSVCGNLSDTDPCPICSDPARDMTLLCVVEHPADLYAIERTGQFRGLYHVLGGVLSPIAGVGPEKLRIENLVERIDRGQARELIVATNPSTEGEATALYLARVLEHRPVQVTRIAHGIPVGGHLGYVDEVTMGKAFEGRRPMSG